MKKNWLATTWAHWFRPEPLVPESAFQESEEPYPGHWRRFPEPWPARRITDVSAALADLPELWRQILIARALADGDDQRVAAEFDLTVEQERDIVARARAAVRNRLDRDRLGGAL